MMSSTTGATGARSTARTRNRAAIRLGAAGALALVAAVPHLAGSANATADPQNGRIAMASFASGTGESEIWDMAADGTDQRQLTSHEGHDHDPAYSPDGSRIAFASNRDGDYEIFVMDADGGNLVQLTHNSVWDRDPAWSPDGGSVAYASLDSGYRKIQVMAADGTGVRLLTPAVRGEGYEREPAWSSHGIAYESIEGGHYDLFVVQPDGSGKTNVTSAVRGDAHQPRWHPSDPVLAFSTTAWGRDRDIALLDLRVGRPRQLTSGDLWEETPAFSPDGTKVAFWQHGDLDSNGKNSNGQVQQDIWAIDVDGSGLTNLTQDGPAQVSPTWQRLPGTTASPDPSSSPSAEPSPSSDPGLPLPLPTLLR